jgi:hypothetical protein
MDHTVIRQGVKAGGLDEVRRLHLLAISGEDDPSPLSQTNHPRRIASSGAPCS